jgi:dolichyl-diphosphooligosaccharide--protein glycosyltransferase
MVSIFAIIFQLVLSFAARGGEARKEFVVKVGIVTAVFIGFISALLISLQTVSPLAGKFVRVLNPLLREVSPAFSSVSENQPASWGTIILSVYLPIVFTPIGIYYFIDDRRKESILALLMVLTSLYFSSSISRFVVVAAPIVATVAGIGLDYLLDPFARILRGEWFVHHIKPIRRALGEQKLPKGEAVVVYSLVILLTLASVNHAVWAARGLTSYDTASYEREAFNYLKMYAKPNDVVLSWWDYGYRLSVLANVTTLADNATSNSTQMGVVGAMLMLPPEKAVKIMKMYNVKYIVIYSVDILKAIWMIRISEKYAPELGVKESDYYSAKDGGYKEKFFESVLWKLLAYQDDRVQFWVRSFAVKDLRDKADQFQVTELKYFKLILNTKRDSNQQNLKIYEVVYRANSHVPLPSEGYNNEQSTLNDQKNILDVKLSKIDLSKMIREAVYSPNFQAETIPLTLHCLIYPTSPQVYPQL